MTINEMLAQGSALHLIGMGIIFIIMIFLISMLGKGVAAKFDAEKGKKTPAPAASAIMKAENDEAVTAAIAAAVNEYRKTNK